MAIGSLPLIPKIFVSVLIERDKNVTNEKPQPAFASGQGKVFQETLHFAWRRHGDRPSPCLLYQATEPLRVNDSQMKSPGRERDRGRSCRWRVPGYSAGMDQRASNESPGHRA